MRGTPRARPLARLPPHRGYPLLPLANAKKRKISVPWLRCPDGDGVAGLPDDRGADRLAPPEEPRRLDLLWRGLALPASPLRPGRESVIALERVRGLVLVMGGVRGIDPGGSIPDAAVPRWASPVSSLVDCSVGGRLGSRVGSAC